MERGPKPGDFRSRAGVSQERLEEKAKRSTIESGQRLKREEEKVKNRFRNGEELGDPDLTAGKITKLKREVEEEIQQSTDSSE